MEGGRVGGREWAGVMKALSLRHWHLPRGIPGIKVLAVPRSGSCVAHLSGRYYLGPCRVNPAWLGSRMKRLKNCATAHATYPNSLRP